MVMVMVMMMMMIEQGLSRDDIAWRDKKGHYKDIRKSINNAAKPRNRYLGTYP